MIIVMFDVILGDERYMVILMSVNAEGKEGRKGGRNLAS